MTIDTPQDLVKAVEAKLLELYKAGTDIEYPVKVSMGASDPDRVMRASAAGKCPKQMAYRIHYPHMREEPQSRMVSVFLHGNLLHEQERYLISLVRNLDHVEDEVLFHVDNEVGDIKGHTDGVVVVGDTEYVLDIKSVSSYGFKDMVDNGPRDDYVDQLQCYMDALGFHNSLLWLYRKDTGHRAAIEVEYDPERVERIRERFRAVHHSTALDLPERMYEPEQGKRGGKEYEYLPWQCNYCAFTELCWSEEGFEMVIERGKPRWIKEER